MHEQGDGRLDIVDGKQRITSLLSFLDGTFPRTGARFTLEGLETLEALNGRAREELTHQEQQSLQRYPLSLRILGQGSGVPCFLPNPFRLTYHMPFTSVVPLT